MAQYVIMKEESNSVKSARAAVFGEQVVISNFAETQKALEKNVHSLSFDYGGNPLPLGGGRSHLKEKY